jgi:hypothetical protein
MDSPDNLQDREAEVKVLGRGPRGDLVEHAEGLDAGMLSMSFRLAAMGR